MAARFVGAPLPNQVKPGIEGATSAGRRLPYVTFVVKS
jgi:hypothetical protein